MVVTQISKRRSVEYNGPGIRCTVPTFNKEAICEPVRKFANNCKQAGYIPLAVACLKVDSDGRNGLSAFQMDINNMILLCKQFPNIARDFARALVVAVQGDYESGVNLFSDACDEFDGVVYGDDLKIDVEKSEGNEGDFSLYCKDVNDAYDYMTKRIEFDKKKEDANRVFIQELNRKAISKRKE